MSLPAITPTGVLSAWITPVDSSAGTGVTGALSADPGDTNAPIIFEPFWTLSGGMPEVWIIGSGGPNWGGAQVFVSLDSTTYAQVGTLFSGAAQGLLSGTFASGADPDTVNILSVDLTESAGQLIAGTSADADFELPTLAYCDGELVAFSAATLTGPNAYDLDTYIRRGCYDTAIASHAIGTQFGWIISPAAYEYPPPLIGSTIYFKFPSFNTLGAQLQDVSTCVAYPYTLTGVGLRPAGGELVIESKTSDYVILVGDNGVHFDNCGAAADETLTLPTAAVGLTFGFLVCEPFYLKVLASDTDKIARGGNVTPEGGFLRSNLPFSSLQLEAHEAGQWFASAEVGYWESGDEAGGFGGGVDPDPGPPEPPPIVDGFFIAPGGSDAADGSIGTPFASLGRARTAMRLGIKTTTYLRAGAYSPANMDDPADSKALFLDADDSNQTWSYYPPDGVNSAILDGGSSSESTGVHYGMFIFGGSGITIIGLQFKNFTKAGIHVGWDSTTTASPNNTITANIVHDNHNPSYSGLIEVFGNAQNTMVQNNYVYNGQAHGIVMQASGASAVAHGTDNGTIRNNVIFNTGLTDPDCGGIYLQDWSGGTTASQRSTGITIQNNFIRDPSRTDGDFGRGIYLDDGVSNCTITENVVSGKAWACIQVHGGQNNHMNGNVFDLQSGAHPAIVFQNTKPEWVIPMTGNQAENNIVIVRKSGTLDVWVGISPNAAATIQNNAYWNYTAPNTNVNTSGTNGAGNDSSPTYVDPMFSDPFYTIDPLSGALAPPVSFAGLTRSWGPFSFVMPTGGTAASY